MPFFQIVKVIGSNEIYLKLVYEKKVYKMLIDAPTIIDCIGDIDDTNFDSFLQILRHIRYGKR